MIYTGKKEEEEEEFYIKYQFINRKKKSVFLNMYIIKNVRHFVPVHFSCQGVQVKPNKNDLLQTAKESGSIWKQTTQASILKV